IQFGVLPWPEYQKVLAAADVVLCPGYPDEYNRYRLAGKIVEYMLSGKPMVCYAAGIGEDLTHGEDALLLDRYTPSRTFELLLQRADDAPLRRQLGVAARGRAEQWFDVHKAARALFELYTQVIADAPPEQPATSGKASYPLERAWAGAASRLAKAGVQ